MTRRKKGQFSVLQTLFRAALHITWAKGIHEKGFRTVINTGAEGAQVVPHLHLHLIGGKVLTPIVA